MIKKVKKSGIIQKLLNIMNIVASNQLLQYKKTDFKAKRNVRYFLSFIVHSFRFLIVCQSIDPQCLQSDEMLKYSLSRVLRRFELYKKVFPQNKIIIDALCQGIDNEASNVPWFRHN